jgi:transposase
MACSLCHHPRRIAIDADLVVGTSYRTIIHFYGSSLATLHRHSRHYKDVPYVVPEPSPTLLDDLP